MFGQSYQPDLDQCIQDDIPFEPGEGVEEFLQLLEAGKPLPPDAQQIGRPKESAQSFLRRMDALQARYDAQFLKRKDWQVLGQALDLIQSLHVPEISLS